MEGRACPTCGEVNPPEARLCGMCGTSLVHDEAAGEVRRLITLVTSDLKGSTALGERPPPPGPREVLNRYFSVMRAVFESHGGTIEKIIGDAIVAVFGLPFRREDDAVRALSAAAETQRALTLLNDELEQGWGVRLVVRTGVATGEVTFGRSEGGQHVLLGPPVDLSTVMEQNSPSQEVLVDQSTYDAARDLVEVETMDPVAAKGSEERFAAYRLVSVIDRDEHSETSPPEPSPGMRICPSCGEESPERYRLCNTCGASLSEHIARESRRTVTIVFAMPKVHTRTGGSATPEALRDVMSSYFDAMRMALERHGGTVEKFIGDAVMAVFGLPVRHEDDAPRAIRAAADMQAALPALNETFLAGRDIEIENHIGVNTGEVIAGDASPGQPLVTGDAVNPAARLEQAAGPGEIVLGDLTYRLARDQIEIEFIPPLTLKGKAEPVPAYRLITIGRQTSTRESGTPFVGRAAEMARLTEALLDAGGQKRARLINVVGDAGVGKSRLIREFATNASSQARVVRGRCLPYGDGITFWPLAEVVRDAAGITAEDSPEAAIEKIRGLLPAERRRESAASRDERTAIVDRVAAAMNLSTAQFPVAELLWGGRRLLESLARDRPLAMIVDDIHSAETTFLEFLDHLLEAVEGAPILLLCSARHELGERHPDWLAAHEAETIRLEPLTESDAGQIVEELLGSLDASVRARIAEASEGNPLYVEQIVSMLVETGAIERGMDGWVARAGGTALQIPPTVQALVASRLDALGADERAVVEPASVIGLSFPEDAVAELVEAVIREHLEAELTTLTGKQLVRRASGDEAIYRFGHQVIRDTAYGSLLKRVRAALHERFVVWAERVNRERGRELEFEEILGFHLEQAYRYRTEIGLVDDEARDVAKRAAEKLGGAGRRALDRSDLSAATGLLSRAVALQEAGDERRVELLIELSEAFLAGGNLDDARRVAREAIEEATGFGDERLATLARVADEVIDVFRGDVSPEITLGRAADAIALFERLGDEGGQARAWRLTAWQHGSMGHVDDAANDCLHAAEHGVLANDHRIANRAAMGYASYAVNGSLPAAEVAERCRAFLGEVAGDRRAEAVILGVMAQLRAMDGDFVEARQMAQRERQLLLDLGPSAIAFATSLDSSRVEILAGNLEDAEAFLQRDSEDLERLGETYFRSTVVGKLANVVALQGRPDDAIGLSEVGEALAGSDDLEAQILWRMARARSLAQLDRPHEATELGREAVELARKTASPVYLADASTVLGDVLSSAGLDDDAVSAYGRAIELYAAKGDRTSVEQLNEKLVATV